MPVRRARKSNRPLRRKRVVRHLSRPLRAVFNPAPIFTESFALPKTGGQYTLDPNAGGVLSVSMDQMPQLNQYSALYQKYRILKAKFICIPTYNSAAADINSELPAGAMTTAGLSRIVFAVNDSPALPAPVNENAVLVDNGCKIVCGSPKLTMTCHPVPDALDSNGNRFTTKRRYQNFTAINATHYGITWWHTQPVAPGGAGYGIPYLVYVKLTFQLSDPR